MNVLALAGLAAKLGFDIKLSAILPLLPLLQRKPGEIEGSDVVAVGKALGVELPGDVVVELTTGIRTSDFNTMADLLGSEKYAIPLFQRIFMTKERLESLSDHVLVPVKCGYCERINEVKRQPMAVGLIEVKCEACDSIRHIEASAINNYGREILA